jgi:hypothetical protein
MVSIVPFLFAPIDAVIKVPEQNEGRLPFLRGKN